MLQPDLFFAYGLSSGLAIAAGRKLKSEASPWVNKYFLGTVLWLAVLFIPQVLYLLWRFPAWESMFAATDYSDLPAWLVALYPVAVLLLGALGFFVTRWLLVKGKLLAAHLQVGWSMLVATLVVFVGWDGAGYQRLLYAGSGADWAAGVVYAPAAFFSSPVFYTLLWLEALVLIPYSIMFIRWARQGRVASS